MYLALNTQFVRIAFVHGFDTSTTFLDLISIR